MPRISEFFGIKIYLYYNDHNPPHFHALYGEHETKVTIETLSILEGKLPQRAWRLVLEWASLHRLELEENWNNARDGIALNPIEPLE